MAMAGASVLTGAQARRLSYRQAVLAASRAPSVHNSQPWQFVLDDDGLQLRADWSRSLRVVDPLGRQLQLSCGCALFNARVALADLGYRTTVELLPEPMEPALLARLRIVPGSPEPIAELARWIEPRQTCRGPFDDERIAASMISRLRELADAEGALLTEVSDPNRRAEVVALDLLAAEQDHHDPAFVIELDRWLTVDPDRLDGLPALAPAIGAAPPPEGGAGPLLVLSTSADDPANWLSAGAALERILLELTAAGYASVPLMQLIEIPQTRLRLREILELRGYPHVVLRVGHAPRQPASRRRRLADLISEPTTD